MWFRVNVRIPAGKALHFALADHCPYQYYAYKIYYLTLLKELHDFYMSLCVMES